MQKTVVLSLGGSLIFPESVDKSFLIGFKKIIEKYVKKKYRFVIICGGGKLARNFQHIALESTRASNEELDWLGIYATKINAHLLKSVFGGNAYKEIVSNPNEKITFKKNIIIASGWKPGWSTDYDAVLLAKNLKSNTVVNMSNVDYAYDKDPKKFDDARKIEKIGWAGFRKLISRKWEAGMNAPFDPVAAKEAQNSRMKVCIIGRDLRNFGNLLEGKKFKGTIIE